MVDGNRFKVFAAISVVLFVCGFCCGEVFYVATDGADSNAGTKGAPFATLQKARNVVRAKIAAGGKKDVTVIIRGGRYELSETLVFGVADSPPTESCVTYKAYPGQTPVLSGGRIIKDWRSAGGNRWTTRLPEVAAGKRYFRQLYADGQRLERGKYPANGLLRIKGVSGDVRTIEFDKSIPMKNPAGRDVEIVVIQNWSIARSIIESAEGTKIHAKTPLGWVGHGWTTAGAGKPAYIENAIEFVDSPGEWHLDRKTGTLTYIAADGENPNDKVFVAPRVEKLMAIKGSVEKPVMNLRFHGIVFEHSQWNLPAGGYAGIQAGYNGTKNKPNDALENTLPVAIELQYAADCEFEFCRIRHTGASGIGIGAGCSRNRIVGCEVSDIGGNGIHIGLPKEPVVTLDQDWADARDVPAGNEVSNCYIHHCAAESFGAVGLFAAFSEGTRIMHNHVSYMPYTGISIGFRWNTTPTSQVNCIVEGNHIHDVMTKIADGGGIYTLGYQPGTILRGNHIYNVYRSSYAHGGAPNNGIFFDEGSKGFLVEDNVIYNTSGKSIRFNQNKSEWHTWRDNSFGPKPDEENFPKVIAEKAGIEEPYKQFMPK